MINAIDFVDSKLSQAIKNILCLQQPIRLSTSMNYEPQRVFDLHRPQMRVMFVSMQTTFASDIIVAAFDDLAVTRSKRKFTIIFKR